MLAHLLQATTLGLLVGAGAWAAYFLWQEDPAWALGGAFLILFFYAFVLGLAFVLMWLVGRADPAPRATFRQILKAWWGEVLTAPRVFCWSQPFRSKAQPDYLPAGVPSRGVVLVHGFLCNRGVWNPVMRRLRAQGIPFVAPNLEPPFCSIDRYVDAVEAGVRRLELATGLPPLVVAHSMGGLAVRAWMAAHCADDRVHRVITIGSPHHGTFLGRFGYAVNARQMRMGCDWQRALAQREPAERFSRYTCFYGHCDNMVFPAANATLPGADNRHIAGVAHVHMVHHSEVVAEILRWAASEEAGLRRAAVGIS